MNILIKSAKIIDPNSPFNRVIKDILIQNGIVTRIEDSIVEENITTIQEDNLHISPGLFDMRCNFREPGFEQHETLKDGLNAAEKGGFTGVAVMPNTFPVADNSGIIEQIIQRAKNANANVSVFPIGTVSQKMEGKELSEMYDMTQSGAVAFSDDKRSISDDNLMSRALLYAQNFDGLIMNFPDNKSISGHGQIHEGIASTQLGLEGIPSLSEELMVSRDLFLANYNESKIHIGPISSSNSVSMIKEAKENGIKVTCDIAAHQLFFKDEDCQSFDSNYKVKPPFRDQNHYDDILEALKLNIIDVISSDHTPWDVEEKQKEFDLAKFGISTIETAFSVAITSFEKTIGMESIITKMAINPRSILKLDIPIVNKGFAANFVLYNPDATWSPTEENWTSKSMNSPFIGKTLKGKVYSTLKS